MDTITVRSNDPIVESNDSVGTDANSAPELEKDQEQKPESTESDTVEKEQEEDSEESDESQDESEDSEKEIKAKKKGGFKRRIDKLNARISEREKELEYWRQKALNGGNDEGQKPEPKQLSNNSDDRPDPENFDSHAEYVEALTDWKVSQSYKERLAQEEKSKMQTEQQKAFQAHVDRFKAYAEKNPDIHELLEEVDDVPMSPVVQDVIVTSEHGPALMHELAKNRPLYESICKMSPLAAARAIGAIEAKMSFSSSDQPITKKITSAPKPLASVGSGKGTISKRLDDPNLSQREYERLRLEQIRNRA